MFQAIENIIADQLIYWAVKLYDGDLQLSLANWILENFSRRLKEK